MAKLNITLTPDLLPNLLAQSGDGLKRHSGSIRRKSSPSPE